MPRIACPEVQGKSVHRSQLHGETGERWSALGRVNARPCWSKKYRRDKPDQVPNEGIPENAIEDCAHLLDLRTVSGCSFSHSAENWYRETRLPSEEEIRQERKSNKCFFFLEFEFEIKQHTRHSQRERKLFSPGKRVLGMRTVVKFNMPSSASAFRCSDGFWWEGSKVPASTLSNR